MTIADEKYMLLTTFRRDGQAVATAVWVVGLDDGKVGFWTSSGSGKVKRLAHTARVTVQACDVRGRITAGSESIEGTAVVATGAELDAVKVKVNAKYGIMTKISKWLGSIAGFFKRKKMPYGDCAVVITLGEPAAPLMDVSPTDNPPTDEPSVDDAPPS